jgi:chemosensory pili system protein ChpA (sensor histidine kinase/response regulator)
MTELASQTLHTVAREVNVALADARTALETHVEQPENNALLERCALELHQVHGVLRLLEIYGAALLAEEMEHVARYLIALGQEHKNQAEALDALMRAMVQLPGYLERVLAGGRDLALVLLPLLNDLRAVRGSALLSEGTLLLLNLKSDRQARPAPPEPGQPVLSVAQQARRLRPRFQLGLVGWIRGERVEHNLEALSQVAGQLEQVATAQAVFQLWWVVGALIEALREGGVEAGVSVKRLLGLADREIKRLYEQGEPRYAQSPPVELLNNLLYYIARSSTAGPRIATVRSSFRLGELLPVDEAVEQERESLSAPSIKLMHTVAAAIREDLSKVKDVLDIFVRRGGGQPDELVPQVALLKKIGDTLGVLGLGELRGFIKEATAELEAIAASREPAEEPALVRVAATLIKVEDRLDDGLVGLILPRQQPAEGGEPDQDFQQVQAAVLRECVVNLARVKEYVAQNVGGTLDTAAFDSWPELMRGIKAGLLMLGKSRAVDVIEAISLQLRRVMQPGGATLPAESLDRLADAIVSLEYYIETLQAGRSDPWYMLDNAQTCLDILAKEPPRPVPTVAPVSEAHYARTVRIAPLAGRSDADMASAAQLTRVMPPVVSTHSPAPLPVPPVLEPAAPPPVARPDPDLIRLFAEEAAEEVARIQQFFPVWDRNPLEAEALLTVRRAYHTLKGSGRMVDARNISEFAWAMESLLNRVLEGTLQRSPAILELLRAAMALLPSLVADLDQDSGGPRGDATQLAARAHALASGRSAPPDAETAAVPVSATGISATGMIAPAPNAAAEPGEAAEAVAETAPPLAAMAAETPAAEPGPDNALQEIYARETASHVANVRQWVSREQERPAPHVLPEEIYRACHTLSGSSTMAEVRHGIRLAEPINHWLRKSFDSGVGLDDADLALLADSMTAMENVAGHLDEGTGFFVRHDDLRERIARAEFALDRRITESTALPASVPPESALEAAKPPGSEPAPPFPAESLDVVGQPLAEVIPEMLPATPLLDAQWEPAFAPAAAPQAPAAMPAPVLGHEIASEPLATTAEAEPAAEEPVADFDPEIAAIFSEEAVELLEAADAALASWNSAPGDSARVAALKRPLHTLKGGARMANVSAMGELAHELETLVIQIDMGMAAGDERARALAQRVLDELSRMREALAAGRASAPAHGLIALIHAASRGEFAAAPLQAPPLAPTVPPPMVSAEPLPEPAPVAQFAPPQTGMPADLPAELLQPEPQPMPSMGLQPALPPEPLQLTVGPSASDAAPVVPTVQPAAPAPLPPGREPVSMPSERVEMARVAAELLDQLLNSAGEVSIARARLEQQLGSIEFNLGELSRTVTRLKEQLRKLEIETEAQILHRHENESTHRREFDPLELDRYSAIQQFSRALAESASDVASIQQLLESLTGDAQNLLQHQSRTVTELQNGLMRTRMVSFQRHVQRLARIVRQAATDTGKQAELIIDGASGELDRQVLDRMLPPFEHMLRNSVVHGIEDPATRRAAGKDETGHIFLRLRREGAEVIVEVGDDGAGMNLSAIRNKGVALGLINADQELSDEDAMQLILEPGFSTASAVTHQAGRGVGMDVVATEIKKLGGALHMESTPGKGTRFTIRLPFTLAISHALVVRTGEEYYALPLPTVEGVVRLPRAEVAEHLRADSATFSHGGQRYRLQPLALYVGMEPAPLPEQDVTIPVVLVRAGEHSTGLVADELVGSREIVVKPVGPQISSIRGISGATILGDGRVVIILDIGALVRGEWRGRTATAVARERADRRTFALVVDDSITVRRVTQRLLERNGMRVLTARDGMDAVSLLQDNVPDVILLDIEMPRMDGYEVAAHVRNDPRLRDVPIIMITSRVGEKHRARAIELGVDDYLGKPYQESQLLDAIAPLVAARRAAARIAGMA